MGYYSMNYAIASIIGPAVGGLIYEYNRELVFHLCTVIGFLVIAGFYWLQRYVGQAKPVEAESITSVNSSS